MITKLTVRGYKTLHDFSVELSPVTVVVGANNVGKTNLINAIEAIALAVTYGDIDRAFHDQGGVERVATIGLSKPISFQLEAKFGEQRFDYFISQAEERLRLEGPVSASLSLQQGKWKDPWGASWVNGGSPGAGLKLFRSSTTAPEAVRSFAQFVASMRTADFSPTVLKLASTPGPNSKLGREGQQIAAVLDRLAGEKPRARKLIDAEVHKVEPSIDGVITIPADAAGAKVIGVHEGDNVFRAEQMSDGLLLFVSLSTIAQMGGGATLIALEELERGIHPRRIRECLDQILRVSRSGSQFLLTTHSPILLSEFRDYPEDVVIMERDRKTGATTARRLSDLPDVENQLKDISLGDLWYSGVLGGVPTP